jgi:Superfamily I DNA and RNA helicases
MDRDFLTILEGLNETQKQAVQHIEGPTLIIAGAGSGKTRVLTSRVANLLNQGYRAGSILALTFTNKASTEMKERIAAMVGWERARYLWMGTFHSIFVRFLREYIELLGFPKSFTIYDTSDTRSAIRACIRELSLDEKTYKANEVQSRISIAKNNLITASSYMANRELVQRDIFSRKPRMGEIFALYEKRCRQSGAVDFDDILLHTNVLLRDFPDVLEKLRNRFSHILVDEFQDTNYAQYLIVKKLSQIHRNLCVVGDDAQSIYSFRGAKIENILNFKRDYPEALEFRLEENYRSTQTIVNAANSLIARNSMRLKKECFSNAAIGEKIEVVKAYTDHEEAFLLASSIVSKIYATKCSYSEFAVLYRTNAQSRAVEEALRKRSLPYKIFGGHSFYERAEVKDVISYLRLVLNPKDDEAFRRVINVPARGIGETTVGRLSAAAVAGGVSIWEALSCGDISSFGIREATAAKIGNFCRLINKMREKVQNGNAFDVASEVFIRSGYAEYLKNDTSVEGQAKYENVEELFNSIKTFTEEREAESELVEDEGISASLESYLENISLMSAIDESSKDEDSNKISLMTIHSAKGLEFSFVHIIGVEENLFPSVNSSSKESEIEEERRLMYVAITRARKSVTLSYAQSRLRWGSHVSYLPSRFLREIDPKYLNWPALELEEGIAGNGSDNYGRNRGNNNNANIRTNNSTGTYIGRNIVGSGIVNKVPNPDFVADPISKLKEGQRVEHDRFGFGLLIKMEGDPLNLKAIVDFEQGGRKVLLLKFAKIRVVE